ncbi:hypothetical protein [Candidatus Poriferisocius sp.]|uniref:hypothetical protein n=1 Tax=Candidatus Poriferisocius sp. TaxID=3101276 RepID=UPI003B021755
MGAGVDGAGVGGGDGGAGTEDVVSIDSSPAKNCALSTITPAPTTAAATAITPHTLQDLTGR